MRREFEQRRRDRQLVGRLALIGVCLSSLAASAQQLRRLEPGTTIPVRTNMAIDVDRQDNRVYTGVVEQDVRGDDGRIAVPRGSAVELFVRVADDNDLIIDLESVVANGERYAIKAEPNRIESQRDTSLVGSLIGVIPGATVRGRAVRIPRDSVVNFRLDRPLDVGVPDRGVQRNGWHYHDSDRDDRR